MAPRLMNKEQRRRVRALGDGLSGPASAALRWLAELHVAGQDSEHTMFRVLAPGDEQQPGHIEHLAFGQRRDVVLSDVRELQAARMIKSVGGNWGRDEDGWLICVSQRGLRCAGVMGWIDE